MIEDQQIYQEIDIGTYSKLYFETKAQFQALILSRWLVLMSVLTRKFSGKVGLQNWCLCSSKSVKNDLI